MRTIESITKRRQILIMHYKHFTLAVLLYFFTFYLSASVDDCYARLDSGILSIGNSLIERNFLWNDGQLITLSIHDKENGKIWLNQQKTIDLYIPGISKAALRLIPILNLSPLPLIGISVKTR